MMESSVKPKQIPMLSEAVDLNHLYLGLPTQKND